MKLLSKILNIPINLIDKLINHLKTDRNTFFTYILTLCSVYIAVDRIVEMLFMIFTGIGLSYWNPIQYTIALACPIFAFLFSCSSKFATGLDKKFTFFVMYIIMLYITALSMLVQGINRLGWLFLLSVPNYVEIVTQFFPDVKRAFCAIAIYFPLTTFWTVFWAIYGDYADVPLHKQSIMDYPGLDISKKPEKLGAYSYEIDFGPDFDTGIHAVITNNKRFEPTLVCGVSGSGKTSLVFEPMIAHDIKQKFFFHEASKELGFAALKTGLASLNCPYDNDYINSNFSLNMLTVKEGKEKLYNSYMHKMLLDPNKKIYRDLGITSLSPDFETLSHMISVAENYNFKYKLVDPANSNSCGINPFAYGTPEEVAVLISSILTNMYFSQHPTPEEAFHQNTASQAVENLSILLAEMYPRLHDGAIANIEDILDMLNDFDLAVKLSEKMNEDPELSIKYKLLINYFKKYFGNEEMRKDTEKHVYTAITQLDNLLRISGLRNILCNRTNNINFEKALAHGDIIFVCTRRGDLGPILSKAFGLFFLLSMQNAVLKRPGNENNRIANFLYIDEFADYVCSNTLPLFTLYRKYRVGTVVSIQNITQLEGSDKATQSDNTRETIVANCTTKFVFGNNSPEDNAWWSKEMGHFKRWIFSQDYHIEQGNIKTSDMKGAKWDYAPKFKPEALQTLGFKKVAFKTRNDKGALNCGRLNLNFLASEHKEIHKSKTFDFSRFNGSGTTTKKVKTSSKQPSYISQDNFEPIKSTSSFLFNNDDAIIFDINQNNDDE